MSTKSPQNKELTIRIHKKQNPYVFVDRRVLENLNLSFEAKGLYCYIISCDPPPTFEDLVSLFPSQCKIEARKYVDELIKFGYLKDEGVEHE